jgi:hypothetical protein
MLRNILKYLFLDSKARQHIFEFNYDNFLIHQL